MEKYLYFAQGDGANATSELLYGVCTSCVTGCLLRGADGCWLQ